MSVNRAAVVAPVGALRHGALRGVARPAQGSRGHPESTGPERGFLHPHSGGAAAALEWQNAPRMTSTNPGGERETLRLHQANERTLLAWIRTGIALMAFGFAIERFALFMRQLSAIAPAQPAPQTLASSWVGAALVALGMLSNLLATIRYARVRRAIERGDVGAPSAAATYALGVLATLIGVAMTVMLVKAIAQH